jgi:hypothetical protein
MGSINLLDKPVNLLGLSPDRTTSFTVQSARRHVLLEGMPSMGGLCSSL